jgi:xanthine/CO dehydrogenase XdhC/CoxF family maturation factor
VSKVDDLDTALEVAGRLGSNDVLVVLTHLSDVDTPVLATALQKGVGFVGALGSRQTQAKRAHGFWPKMFHRSWSATSMAPLAWI